ncbi:MAG: DUF3540 domain-containing protein [Myxococcales bacterium]|nr:DUF3540 domain-containing protein [Myxococcales bacterium]
MDNLARNVEWQAATSETGVVARVVGREVWVRGGRETVRAERATSCLVEPEEGDFVLYCTLGSGAAYVLAVLEREPGQKLRIAPEGDVELEVGSGRLRLAARDGIDLATEKDTAITARELRVAAGKATFAVAALSYLGRLVDVRMERARVVAQGIDTVADRVMARVKRAYRFVEELDVKRADRIDHRAERDYRLAAENALVTAAELVKLDGQQIHLG